jgi:hypothetical protein
MLEGSPYGSFLSSAGPKDPRIKAVTSSRVANALAFGIREAVRPVIRRHAQAHLFLATPIGLAMLLGHRWNAMPATIVYEDLMQLGYESAFTIPG